MVKPVKYTTTLLIIMMVTLTVVKAQSMAGSTASATIMNPVIFSLTEDISFNILEISEPETQELVSKSGGNGYHSLFIPKTAMIETSEKAVFSIENSSGEIYSISTTSIITLTHSNNNDSILAQPFLEENASSKGIIGVDVKLYVDKFQLPGRYTSNDFVINLHFN
jgi:hypothetical protein